MKLISSVIFYLVFLLLKRNDAAQLDPDAPFMCDVCHHFCVMDETNIISCDCFEGYILSTDNRTCRATGDPASLVFESEGNIIKMAISSNRTQVFPTEDNKTTITGLDFSLKTDTVFYSMADLGEIRFLNMATNNEYAAHGLGVPQAIAVDWITENIYYVDNGTRIGVCHMNKQTCVHIVQADTENWITSLLVDPLNGFLFYVSHKYILFDRSRHYYSFTIYKSNLDGSNVTEIITVRSMYYVCLDFAMDFNKQILYYPHTTAGTVESVTYQGTNRKVILRNIISPLYLDIFEDEIFMSAVVSGKLFRCKLTGNCTHFPTAENIDRPFFMKVYQTRKQPSIENPCSGYYCDYICVNGPQGPRCLCEEGFAENYDWQCSSLKNITVSSFIESIECEQEIIEEDIILENINTAIGIGVSGIIISFVGLAIVACIIWRNKIQDSLIDVTVSYRVLKERSKDTTNVDNEQQSVSII